jgi:O-antigen ligase
MPVWSKVLRWIRKWSWWLLLLLLPVTSMPIIVKLVHSDTVAAPSGVLLVILVIFWLIPYFFFHGKLPKTTIPLFVFLGIAIAASALAFFYHIPIYKNHSVTNETLTALVTLGIGIAFYLVTVSIIRDEKWLRITLQMICIAGALIIIWSILQSISWFTINRYPNWMKAIHDLYSVGPLYRQRVSGFALEPSWLAHQLNILFIPYWLGATLAKTTVFRWKIWKVSIENLLLVLGMGILLLTSSRIGLAALLVMLAIPVLRVALQILEKIDKWITSRPVFLRIGKGLQILVKILWVFCLIVLAAAVVIGLGYILTKLDMRMRSLFEFDFQHRNALLYYAEKLSLAARFVYWDAGWGVFEKFPWLGVGLGNSGFFFPETLNPYAWKLTEVRMLLYRSDLLLNPKSLWIRLLAETGIIGFSAFFSWLFAIGKSIPKLLHLKDPTIQSIGWMGMFSLVGLFFEGFSLDTFGLPYYWMALGIVSCMAVVNFSEKQNA